MGTSDKSTGIAGYTHLCVASMIRISAERCDPARPSNPAHILDGLVWEPKPMAARASEEGDGPAVRVAGVVPRKDLGE